MTTTRPTGTEAERPVGSTAPEQTPGEPTRDEGPDVGDPPGTGTAEPRRALDPVVERCGWSLVWLAVLVGGLDLWGSWSSWSLAGVVAPAVVLAGVVGLVATWVIRDPRSLLLSVPALVSASVSIVGNQGSGIHLRQFYTTDSAAFNQVAARLLYHDTNPYTASLASADRLLQTPMAYWTYTVSGGHITAVSYPAGSFLLELPLLELGFRHMIVDWADLFAWVLTGVLLFVLMPPAVRWFAVLLYSVPVFAAIFGSGGTDAAFLPFLVLAVWRWDRFATGRRAGLANWMGPVALGLACSIKQTPWFCVPFLLVGVFMEARASGRRPLGRVAGYLAVVLGVFVVVNLPFIVWQPSAWLRGTLLPLTHPLVGDGQGLVTLALHGYAHGASFPLLTVAGLLVFVSLLAAMVVRYPVAKRTWMLALPLVFFVEPRSLSSYLLDFYPAAIVAAFTVAPALRARGHSRGPRPSMRPAGLAVVVPALAAVVVCVVAFAAPPLDMAVRSVVATQTATSLDAVTLSVRNTTGGTVTPHFMVTIGSEHPDGFWHPADHRPVVLGPGASTTVTIVPPGYTSAPAHGTHWLVEAYTSSPEALSTTPLLFWKLGKPPAQTP